MRIETLTHHGMGRAEDGSLWPRVLPGEEIDPEGRIVTPSSDRVSAPCPHANACGGCSVQHASDAFVARWKVGIVSTALAAHGINLAPRKIHVSPPASRRRAKLSARRTKKGALVGFHGRASDQIVATPNCAVMVPQIAKAIPALEALTSLIGSRKGELALTVTASDAGPDVQVEGGKDPNPQDRVDLAAWADQFDIARLTLADEVIVTRCPPAQPFGAARVVPPPGAFLQATASGEATLVAGVRAALKGCEQIADLFAGSGTFALPLASAAEVHAVEGSAPMLDALHAGWRGAQGLHRVTTEARDLFRNPMDRDDLARFDGIVLDPPRVGAHAQVMQIAEHGPERLAYVSCNPVSFAKDAARLLAAGYEIASLEVVDQFRWSHHVELIAAFTR